MLTEKHITEFINRNDKTLFHLSAELGIKRIDNLYIKNIIIPICYYLNEKRSSDKVMIISLTGGQGSGKTTMSRYISFVFETLFHLRTIDFSLDDIYFGKEKREKMGNEIHRLCRTRGVPGTHDVKLGIETLLSLINADNTTKTLIPSFSKVNDDCYPISEWNSYLGRPDVIIFEGWCSGLRPIQKEKWMPTINKLEKNFDKDGIWAKWSYNQLAGNYQDLFSMFDFLIFISLDSMKRVFESRWLQEKTLSKTIKNNNEILKLMTKEEVYYFVMHFERITKHLFEELPKYSDFVLQREKNFIYKLKKTPKDFFL